MNVDPAGPLCGCGRSGCWEALIGLGALLRATGTGGSGTGPEFASPEAEVTAVARHAETGDPRTLVALSDLGHWVGVGRRTSSTSSIRRRSSWAATSG